MVVCCLGQPSHGIEGWDLQIEAYQKLENYHVMHKLGCILGAAAAALSDYSIVHVVLLQACRWEEARRMDSARLNDSPVLEEWVEIYGHILGRVEDS